MNRLPIPGRRRLDYITAKDKVQGYIHLAMQYKVQNLVVATQIKTHCTVTPATHQISTAIDQISAGRRATLLVFATVHQKQNH